MDGSRFDAWTRRRFGVVAGGLAGSLLALAGRDDAEAKKRHKKKCKKLGDSCDPSGKRKCCHGRLCGFPINDDSLNHCCRGGGDSCTPEHQAECCTGVCQQDLSCFCKGSGQICTSHAQCCSHHCEPVNAHSECQ